MKSHTELFFNAAPLFMQGNLLTLPVAEFELLHILCSTVNCPNICGPCLFKNDLVCCVHAGYPCISDGEVKPRTNCCRLHDSALFLNGAIECTGHGSGNRSRRHSTEKLQCTPIEIRDASAFIDSDGYAVQWLAFQHHP